MDIHYDAGPTATIHACICAFVSCSIFSLAATNTLLLARFRRTAFSFSRSPVSTCKTVVRSAEVFFDWPL